jgi:hypothetical protein
LWSSRVELGSVRFLFCTLFLFFYRLIKIRQKLFATLRKKIIYDLV